MRSLKIHTILMNGQHDILYVSKVEPINKIMLKVATEMQSNLKNKAPERCQPGSGVFVATVNILN